MGIRGYYSVTGNTYFRQTVPADAKDNATGLRTFIFYDLV